MEKRIIICGYPKSGNTWLTRLVAEIVGCPVTGFWCDPSNDEEAIEGLDRDSEYQCFKAHHNADQMARTLSRVGNGSEKIIYIYRDPRSVVVSAAHYFRFSPDPSRFQGLMEKLPKGASVYRRLFSSRSSMYELMAKCLVEGTELGAWLDQPWKQHVAGYLGRQDSLALSYESLTQDPLEVANRICGFLSVSRAESLIKSAIEVQSFAVKKKEFEEAGKRTSRDFMRRGQVDSWRNELPAKSVTYLEREIGDFMQQLGYQLSSGV